MKPPRALQDVLKKQSETKTQLCVEQMKRLRVAHTVLPPSTLIPFLSCSQCYRTLSWDPPHWAFVKPILCNRHHSVYPPLRPSMVHFIEQELSRRSPTQGTALLAHVDYEIPYSLSGVISCTVTPSSSMDLKSSDPSAFPRLVSDANFQHFSPISSPPPRLTLHALLPYLPRFHDTLRSWQQIFSPAGLSLVRAHSMGEGTPLTYIQHKNNNDNQNVQYNHNVYLYHNENYYYNNSNNKINTSPESSSSPHQNEASLESSYSPNTEGNKTSPESSCSPNTKRDKISSESSCSPNTEGNTTSPASPYSPHFGDGYFSSPTSPSLSFTFPREVLCVEIRTHPYKGALPPHLDRMLHSVFRVPLLCHPRVMMHVTEVVLREPGGTGGGDSGNPESAQHSDNNNNGKRVGAFATPFPFRDFYKPYRVFAVPQGGGGEESGGLSEVVPTMRG